MQDLKVTLIQTNPLWHDSEANMNRFAQILPKEQSDIIMLPEMFTTGFTMASEAMAEKMHGPAHQWMKIQASRTGAALCGSIIIEEGGKFFNRLLWVEPDGKTLYYDKRHLFRMAEEHNYFSEGNNELIVNYKGWKIKPLICYDLRFPVWARNKVDGDVMAYDLLIFVANWPQARISAWDTLLKARAIENSSYTIGVNRTGKDEKEIVYNGHSGVYGPRGDQLYFADSKESVDTITLSYDTLVEYRKKFPSHLDAESFDIL